AGVECYTGPFDRGDQVCQAARTTRVSDFARTASGRDVLAHPLDGVRPSSSGNLVANVGFVFAEAIADRPFTDRFLCVDAHANVSSGKCPFTRIEVHDVALGDSAEPVLARVEPR